MLDLQALPEDMRDKVIDKMFDVCCDMDHVELRAIRLVCVRLAATFYKRCIMTVMLTRYRPFRFAATYSVPHAGGIAQYDLHAILQELLALLPTRLHPFHQACAVVRLERLI